MSNPATAPSADVPVSPTSPVLAAAWRRHQDMYDTLRARIEATDRFQLGEQHRAKAYHVLIETRAYAYNWAIAPRMTFPRAFRNTNWQTDIYTLGVNGPDFTYTIGFLDGQQTYRIIGSIGDVRLYMIQVMEKLTGNVLGACIVGDMDVAEDGTFEIILSADKREGNWLPLDPAVDYHYLQFRRATGEWNETPGWVKIERISAIEDGHYDADEFDETALARRIDYATDFCAHAVNAWIIGLYDRFIENANGPNGFSRFPGAKVDPAGSPSSDYVLGTFDFAEDEALVIECDSVPSGIYWSFQLADVWARTLNFQTKQSSLSFFNTVPDGDGKLRLVICQGDPGYANWLDPDGRSQGEMVFRNYEADVKLTPVVKKIKRAELDTYLPPNTPRVTAAQRQFELDRRRDGYRAKHEI